jgi:hypothetical protein
MKTSFFLSLQLVKTKQRTSEQPYGGLPLCPYNNSGLSDSLFTMITFILDLIFGAFAKENLKNAVLISPCLSVCLAA